MKYPPGTRFNVHGRILHVVSYTENGGLGLTAIDPGVNHEAAVAARESICACCVGKLDQLRVICN